MLRSLLAFVLGAALALPVAAIAQPRQPNPLTDRLVYRLPGMDDVRVREGIEYARTDSGPLAFDLYLPKSPAATPPPVVLFVNGVDDPPGMPMRRWGGYRDWGRLCAVRGLAAIVHDTRRGHVREDPAALLAWLRREGAGIGVDGSNVIVWCSSANTGAGWAMIQDPANEHVRAGVVYYGAPDTTLRRPTLPVLLVRAGLDAPVFNIAIDAMTARALRVNAPVTTINFANGRHAFDIFDDDDLSRATVAATLEWMVAQASPGVRAAHGLRAEERTARGLAAQQRWAEAEPPSAAWVAAEPANLHAWRIRADVLYGQRRYVECAEAYARCGEGGLMPGITWYNAACGYALAGRKDDALSALEKALGTGFIQDPTAFRRDPDLASLAGDPRFEAMAAPRPR